MVVDSETLLGLVSQGAVGLGLGLGLEEEEEWWVVRREEKVRVRSEGLG